MKKVLIITYYWPPSGGAGVQRWLKFSKYLPENGWQPIIYTPENPDFAIQDDSLLGDVAKETQVLKTKIWEPYGLYKKLIGKKGESTNAGFLEGENKNWKQQLSIFVRGNMFIPDPRVFWVNSSVKYLTKYLKENQVDAIVSTGPPHSMHLIALGLKKRMPDLKWIADFRDPWTEIDFYKDLQLTKWADNKHHKLEKEVVTSADKVITVSQNWAKNLETNHKRKVEVITNGFDHEDFSKLDKEGKDNLLIVHLGSMNKDRNPMFFWEAIADMAELNHDLKVELIGNIDKSVKATIVELSIENKVKHTPYLAHKAALKKAKQATFLLLPINDTPNLKGIIPAKLFEYLALKIPIICIGPKDGDSAKIITETNSGIIFEKHEAKKLKEWLSTTISGKSSNTFTFDNVDQFSRKELTKKLVTFLE
jgi:glycosyltransferase involved in cell wall biosynthesis